MKVLLINGSPHEKGCTAAALQEVAAALEHCGVEAQLFWIGNQPVRGCIGCGGCAKQGKGDCVFGEDGVNAALQIARECDGLIGCSILERELLSSNRGLPWSLAAEPVLPLRWIS